MERDELVCVYSALRLSQKEIVDLLQNRHGVSISERHVRRVLRKHGLSRNPPSDVTEVADFISNNLDRTGSLHGYRIMHQRCLLAGMNVSRETVRLLLHQLDPEGVELRKRRRLVRRRYRVSGPNYLWHIDSYDKLKPFGITINGCIDGFSRYVIWMEAYTNATAKLVGGYFVQAVENSGGCPVLIRADRGTENAVVRQIQIFLREHQNDDHAFYKSFIYGRSTANQRIENWWSTLRRQNSEFWMNLFHGLKANGHFNGDPIEKELIRLIFTDLIQKELDDFVLIWNTRYLRKARNESVLYSRPYFMYTSPQSYGTTDYLVPVDQSYIDVCREECAFKREIPCDSDVHELCRLVMQQRGWTEADDTESAVELYVNLRQEILQLLS